MKCKTAIVAAAATAAVALSACGDHNSAGVVQTPVAIGPPKQALDTAQVLALAQTSSEVDQPLQVDGGQLTLTDSSDTTEPINVNAM
jgi:hypothetical protein